MFYPVAVIKAWYDQEAKKYIIQNVESVENVYALWNNDDFRQLDSIAYVYQISVDKAVRLYDLKQDEIVTSPAGQPFGPLGATESPSPVTTSQPMITVIEVTGTIPGWSTDGNGNLITCKLGKERKLNAIVVGTKVVQVIDDEKKLPNYYILPNKRVRRRAWGSPDISESAIEINMTYIETLSDWRTVASKVNFPKFKAFGFSLGTQIPKPQPRKVEILPLGENQDIVPLTQGQSAGLGETDFPRQIEELKDEFVREVGISRQLFDLPDQNGNSNPALLTAMKSVSDITTAKRKLWEPIIRQIFEDALRTIAKFDDDVKQIVETDDNWFIKVSFPSAMNAEDPTFHSMIMNQFNTGILSAQTAVEKLGYDKQEIDQIRAEMEDPLLAAIHAHTLPNFANSKLPQTGPEPPKVNINLRGDLSPEQEGNLAYQRGFNEGPFGTSIAPQGNAGLTAQANEDNQGLIEGNRPTGGIAISRDPEGNPLPNTNGVQPPNGQGVNQPELINGAASQGQGVGIMSQPGTGAPMTTANGKMKQMQQRQGA